MDEDKYQNKLKSGLVLWAQQRGITPVAFARKMNYQYATAWDLLRGKRPFTSEAFGRFAIAFGTQAAGELMKLAELPDGVDIEPISDGQGKIVPAVSMRGAVYVKNTKVHHKGIIPAQKTKRRVVETVA